MSYETRYEGSEADKKAKALADCEEWLGKKQYNKVRKILQQGLKDGASKKLLIFGLSMQGIQGYPAVVMVENAVEEKTKISGELSSQAVV